MNNKAVAIQSGLDAASGTRSVQSPVAPQVYFPAGAYNISSSLVTGCALFLSGDGPTSSVIFQTHHYLDARHRGELSAPHAGYRRQHGSSTFLNWSLASPGTFPAINSTGVNLIYGSVSQMTAAANGNVALNLSAFASVN